jgi:hypothetical protein
MREKSHRKKATDSTLLSRISILFFYTFFLELLVWAENFGWYRRDFIFYQFLPYLLPILGVLALGGLIYLSLRYAYKGDARKEKVFSTTYLIYLLAGLVSILLLPWLANLCPGNFAFKQGAKTVAYGLLSYFLAYLLHQKIKPASILCWMATGSCLLLNVFHQTYLDGRRYLLNSTATLPVWGAALLMAGLTLGLLFLCLWLSKSARYKIKKFALWIPAAINLTAMAGLTACDPLLSSALIRILTYCIFGAQVLWLIIGCILIKLKKI